MQGVQGGYGGGMCGGLQDDSAWVSSIGVTDLENIGHGGISADISHCLPGKGRTVELPGGGMPRPSGDKDGDAGPPTVLPMQHAGPPEGTERKAPLHRSMRQGSGAKEAAASGGGTEGELGESLRGIRGAAKKGDGV